MQWPHCAPGRGAGPTLPEQALRIKLLYKLLLLLLVLLEALPGVGRGTVPD